MGREFRLLSKGSEMKALDRFHPTHGIGGTVSICRYVLCRHECACRTYLNNGLTLKTLDLSSSSPPPPEHKTEASH